MPIPLFLTCSPGIGWWEINTITQIISLLFVFFFYSYFISFQHLSQVLFQCIDSLYFIRSNYPSAPPLPASHSLQIQKNSFDYRCVTKGHIRQCDVVSISTDTFSGLTYPLAVLCLLLSTCTGPPSLLPCGSFQPWHYPSLSPDLIPPCPYYPHPKPYWFLAQLSLIVYLPCSQTALKLRLSPAKMEVCLEELRHFFSHSRSISSL